MQVDRYIRVRCVNDSCPRPADADVPVVVVAEGVVAVPPQLRCRSCGYDVKENTDASQD